MSAVKQNTRVALYLQDKHPIRDGMEYARYAEARGFEAVWQAESRLVRDAIVPMAAFAAVTERIEVGSGVINNWTRNIGLLAATFLTLDDLAPNRIICGIGAWWDPLAKNVGIERRKPLTSHARDHRGHAAAVGDGAGDFPWRVSSRGWHRTGRGAWAPGAAQRESHDRRDRTADDGADRRDCRRRRAQLLCAAGIQCGSHGAAAARRRPGRAQAGRRSTGPN